MEERGGRWRTVRRMESRVGGLRTEEEYGELRRRMEVLLL